MVDYKQILEAELLRLLKTGDQAAFAEIFSRYHPLLVSFAAKRIQDIQEAEDIVQDVFVWLWNSRDTFEIKVKLSSYLYRATLNRLLNRIKHHQQIDRYASDLASYASCRIADTDYRVREKDINAIIEKEIAQLPPRTCEVFGLRRSYQLSNREIATALNLSEQTVETHIKKALKTLRARLGVVIFIIFIVCK